MDDSHTNAQLATLLTDAYKDLDNIRRDLQATRKRADRAERMLHTLESNPDTAQLKRTFEDYEERIAAAEAARDDSEARRRALHDAWDNLERYLAVLDSRSNDARKAFARAAADHAPFALPPQPGSMPPPPHPPRPSQSFPPLPPHPTPRRPRTPSMETAMHPPAKRQRPSDDRPRTSYSEPFLADPQRIKPQEPRIIERKYAPHAHGSHSSSSSIDVDEMLLRASTTDHKDNNSQPSYTYPATQSTTQSLPPIRPNQSSYHIQHVFTPIVTGAPTKKSKFPNTSSSPAPIQSDSSTHAQPPTTPFASTNAQGQRICRQCGMVGRYKDGKCVEKWGPGPMGPGTVCDRCRKKMKRVERRGTIENQQMLAIQHQQHQPRPQPTIHRAETLPNFSPSAPAPTKRQPSPPSIVSLREPKDDDDDDDSHHLNGTQRKMDVDEIADADADADAEADAEAEILGAVDAATHRNGDGEEEEEEEDEPEPDAEADADADLLEAVDAAEANSSSSHGDTFV